MPMLRFLLRCRRRLDELGFEPNGPIYRVIEAAYCAMHDLYITAHFESVGHGAGRVREHRPRLTTPKDRAQEPPNRPSA
jgi:hypothetical protein